MQLPNVLTIHFKKISTFGTSEEIIILMTILVLSS